VWLNVPLINTVMLLFVNVLLVMQPVLHALELILINAQLVTTVSCSLELHAILDVSVASI